MKCLIIASGQGTRLASKADLKPLVRLLGLSLIARVILRTQRAGIDDFYVVTGYNSERLTDYLERFGRRRNIKITCLYNDEWHKENGISVLKAKNTIKENFILLMADHIFNEAIITKLKNAGIKNDEVMLAIDSHIEQNYFIDHDDVTKVYVKDSKALDIGKNIDTYNAFDTGIFLCSPAIFKALEESIKKGETTLSDGVRILAKKGTAKTCEVNDYYWIDVDDEVRLKQAEEHLTRTFLKKPSDGIISRYINRPLSIRITKLLLRTKIHPNCISCFCFITSTVAALFFFLGGYVNLLIGAMLAQFSSILDGCDGEIARLKFLETEFGGWLDAVLDRYADAVLLLGLTYHTYQAIGSVVWIFIGMVAIIGSLINSYTADKYDRTMRRRGGYYFRIGRDWRIFLIFLGGLFNQPALALSAVAALMNVENIRRVVVLAKA
ncbi:MAG: NTP transferase domain-containing protein [candidate division WOR-3 bacterium]|nr:MAG: NTP transferase domain-containing protein [candidate division WOR-3 bacterium]